MEKHKFVNFVLTLLNLLLCQAAPSTVVIPLGGNAYITKHASEETDAVITDNGLGNWRNTSSVCSVYFKLTKREVFQISLRLKVPSGTSTIRVSNKKSQSYDTVISGSESYIQKIGKFTRSKGYFKLNLQGLTRTGLYYGDVSDVILSNITGEVHYISNSSFLYGRRGPSVHFFYTIPNSVEGVKYFYNEVTVPDGQDRVGCYFMANGFSNGYFGIQRNSATEKTILFSVFSDFVTNDPNMVMAEYMVRLLRKGKNVTVQNFGNEGSGLQSFRDFQWKTGVTYQFLVRGSPVGSVNTTYTGWFRSPETNWQLIASLQKPKVTTNLTALYSFSENFLPDQGYLTRKVYFGNQWVRTAGKNWKEVLNAEFTGDSTAMNGRDDLAGGLSKSGKLFYLKNIGFFNRATKDGTYFTRNSSGKGPPDIDFNSLP